VTSLHTKTRRKAGREARSTPSGLRTDAIRTPGHRAGRSNFATAPWMHPGAKRIREKSARSTVRQNDEVLGPLAYGRWRRPPERRYPLATNLAPSWWPRYRRLAPRRVVRRPANCLRSSGAYLWVFTSTRGQLCNFAPSCHCFIQMVVNFLSLHQFEWIGASQDRAQARVCGPKMSENPR